MILLILLSVIIISIFIMYLQATEKKYKNKIIKILLNKHPIFYTIIIGLSIDLIFVYFLIS